MRILKIGVHYSWKGLKWLLLFIAALPMRIVPILFIALWLLVAGALLGAGIMAGIEMYQKYVKEMP